LPVNTKVQFPRFSNGATVTLGTAVFFGEYTMRVAKILLFIVLTSQSMHGQVNMDVSNSIVNAYERGVQLRNEREALQAQQEVLRAQAEFLRAQREAIERQQRLREQQEQQQREALQREEAMRQQTLKPFYTDQELEDAVSRLIRRYPDWRQHYEEMLKVELSPNRGLSAYDYLLALYLVAKEKSLQEQQAAAWTKALTNFSSLHSDFKEYAPEISKLSDIFPLKIDETEESYIERLYNLAKQGK